MLFLKAAARISSKAQVRCCDKLYSPLFTYGLSYARKIFAMRQDRCSGKNQRDNALQTVVCSVRDVRELRFLIWPNILLTRCCQVDVKIFSITHRVSLERRVHCGSIWSETVSSKDFDEYSRDSSYSVNSVICLERHVFAVLHLACILASFASFLIDLEMESKNRQTNNQMDSNYCCVTCGAEADELSHRYKEGVIKIMHCVNATDRIRLLHSHLFSSL